MCKHHERILLDDKVRIREAFIELIAILVNDIVEGYGNVAESDDDVAADVGVLGGFEDLE
jgi:hypothetical protein